MALWVVEPGPRTTIQDVGRFGYQRFGVPVSGAMDWLAFTAANRLVGNPPEAAGLEFAFEGPHLLADRDCLVAVCGADSFIKVDGQALPGWTSVRVRAGQAVHAAIGKHATWGYLAIAAGLAVPDVLGSASTYLRGAFGGLEGRTLREGDWLFSTQEGKCPTECAGSRLKLPDGLDGSQKVEVRVVLGPQEDWFGQAGIDDLLHHQFGIQAESDRMGYRLEGGLVSRRKGDLLSEGMAFGSIQVPPNGQPIVMMADRPTTGGYPKIGTVIRADLPRLAQLRPGSGQVRFHAVSVGEAQTAFRDLVSQLIIERDVDYLWMQA